LEFITFGRRKKSIKIFAFHPLFVVELVFFKNMNIFDEKYAHHQTTFKVLSISAFCEEGAFPVELGDHTESNLVAYRCCWKQRFIHFLHASTNSLSSPSHIQDRRKHYSRLGHTLNESMGTTNPYSFRRLSKMFQSSSVLRLLLISSIASILLVKINSNKKSHLDEADQEKGHMKLDAIVASPKDVVSLSENVFAYESPFLDPAAASYKETFQNCRQMYFSRQTMHWSPFGAICNILNGIHIAWRE
jgi:hypothetical protein